MFIWPNVKIYCYELFTPRWLNPLNTNRVAVKRAYRRITTPPPGDSPLWQWRPATDQRFVCVSIPSLDFFHLWHFSSGIIWNVWFSWHWLFVGDTARRQRLTAGGGSVKTICHTSVSRRWYLFNFYSLASVDAVIWQQNAGVQRAIRTSFIDPHTCGLCRVNIPWWSVHFLTFKTFHWHHGELWQLSDSSSRCQKFAASLCSLNPSFIL